ncbi:MAG: HEPN domain-containing protein [Anaerolineae bacterium]|nr:HEPN domain-containing protein [Anaerolineae bacterium]
MSAQPPHDWVKEWLGRARSDLVLCKTALETPGILREDACYHAQQSVEKALKALLTAMNVAYPRTHSLDVLLCPMPQFSPKLILDIGLLFVYNWIYFILFS